MNKTVLRSKIDFVIENDLVYSTFQMYIYDTFINDEKIDETVKKSIDLNLFDNKIYIDIPSHSICKKLFKVKNGSEYKKIKIEFKDKPFKLIINVFKTDVIRVNKNDFFDIYYLTFKGKYKESENKKILESVDLIHRSHSNKLFLNILANYIRNNIGSNDEIILTLYE